MSKLDELLRELCPNGVEYKKLGEIATISRGGNFQKKDFLTEGVPCIHYGQIYTKYGLFADKTFTFISEECAKKQKMAQPNDIVMAVTSENIEDVCKCLAWLGDEPAAISGHSAIIHHNQNAKYLVYYFHSQMFFAQKRKLAHGTKVIEVTPDALVDITLPLPPIEVQREIVRILDNFTNLTAELTAELTARKTQYGYYRDKVLTPKDDVVVETLGNICRFVRGPFGGALKKEIFKPTGYAVYEQQHAIYRKLEFRYYIDKQKYEELKRFAVHPGEMIVSCSGTIGKTFVIPENAPEGVINQALLKLTPTSRINVFYLQYFFDNTISKILNSVARGGAIKNVPSVEELKAIKIPIPTLEVQQRLVEVLDNFEKICSDLNIGLPAEIEARQKQYEYYRDKLLTFAETGNTILSRAEQSRAEQSRAEQSRAEQSKALIKLVQYVYGCVWLELGNVIVSLNTGLNPRKFFKLNTEDATNYYITIREMKDGKIVPSEKTDRMNDEARMLCNNRSNLEVGDVLFSGTGTIGETAVIEKEPSNWNIKEGVYAIKPNQTMIQPMYLRYILMTDFIKKEYMKKAAGGTVQSVPMGELKKIKIPVPSLQEQSRITGVLKQLDDLCNDLTSGLPAEIEARQKQYEYYRDKLLTFKEVAAT